MREIPLRRGNSAITQAARLLVWACGGALVVMSILITVEALLRKFLGQSFGGVDELSSYVFAVTAAIALPYAILQRANIRIDIIRNLLPGRLRILLDILAWSAFTVVFGFIAWRACGLAWDSWLTGARSITPLRSYLAIPQGLWALGLTASVAASLWVGFRALVLATAGHRRAAAALLSPADEVAQELSAVLPQSGHQPIGEVR